MSKSKSKNRKQNQLLRQRKKEREITEQKIEDSVTQIRNTLKEELDGNVRLRNRNNSPKRKISDIVSEMIQPLLEEARSFDEEQKIVGLGIIAWNLGIIKAHKGEKGMLESLKSFGKVFPKEIKEMLLEFSEIKCIDYNEYDQLIVGYDFTQLNDHQNNLTVSYKSYNE